MDKTKNLLTLLTLAVLMGFWTVAYSFPVIKDQGKTLDVQTWKGKHVGSVKYVVMDPPDKITFLIFYHEESKKEIAVPIQAFSSFDHENGILILKVSENQLASAPEFHESDMNDSAFAERVHRFFGLAPSWSEEGKGEGKSM